MQGAVILSIPQKQAVDSGHAVRVADAQTQAEYVVISAEVFERLAEVLQIDEVEPSFFDCEEIESPGE